MKSVPNQNKIGGKKIWPGRFKLLIVLAIAAYYAVAVNGQWPDFNSHIHEWVWRRLPSMWVYPPIFLTAIPFFLGQWLYYAKGRKAIHLALALLMLSTYSMAVVSSSASNTQSFGVSRIAEIIQIPMDTGYFTDAAKLKAQGMSVSEILRQYPLILPTLSYHPRIKPPGPLLFNMAVIDLFGSGSGGALACGLLIGLFISFSVPACYLLLLQLGRSRKIAFTGASFMALCPAVVLHFPMLDGVYSIFTAAILILWALALQEHRLRYAVALGLVAGVASFTTYLPAVLVFFMMGYTWLRWRIDPLCNLRRIFTYAVATLACLAAFYLLLWLLVRFDPIGTFRVAYFNQQMNMVGLDIARAGRHLPGTIRWDLYDFALGTGWISYFIIAFFCLSLSRQKRAISHRAKIAMVAIALPVFIAVTGLIQAETSRVWQFMLPLLMFPLGIELKRWTWPARLVVYLTLVLLTGLICQNMSFQG